MKFKTDSTFSKCCVFVADVHSVYLVTKQTSYRDCLGGPVGGSAVGFATGSGPGGGAGSTLLPSSS